MIKAARLRLSEEYPCTVPELDARSATCRVTLQQGQE